MAEAWDVRSTADLIAKFNACLVDNGIPVYRFRLIISTLHPLLYARTFCWTRGESDVTEFDAHNSIIENEEYLNSPFATIIDGGAGIRRRLDTDNPQLDYPVLAELRDTGITDYVTMRFTFSDRQINVFSIATDRPRAFSTADLAMSTILFPSSPGL